AVTDLDDAIHRLDVGACSCSRATHRSAIQPQTISTWRSAATRKPNPCRSVSRAGGGATQSTLAALWATCVESPGAPNPTWMLDGGRLGGLPGSPNLHFA